MLEAGCSFTGFNLIDSPFRVTYFHQVPTFFFFKFQMMLEYGFVNSSNDLNTSVIERVSPIVTGLWVYVCVQLLNLV